MEDMRQKQQRPSVLRQVFQTASTRQHGMQTFQCPQLQISNIVIPHSNNFMYADFFQVRFIMYVFQCAINKVKIWALETQPFWH